MSDRGRWERVRTRRHGRTAAGIASLAILAITLAWFVVGRPLSEWWSGEITVWGERIYTPPHPVDAEALARADLEQVHAVLLPAWAAAATVGGSNAAYDALRGALSAEPNLTALVDALDGAVAAGPRTGAARVDYLAWAWNHYLDTAHAPYRIDLRLRPGPDLSARLSLRTYEVVAEATLAAGEVPVRTRVLRRLDRGPEPDDWLGNVSSREDGAMLVLGPVRDLALTDVWPLLDPGAAGELDPRRKPFASAVQDAATEQISARALATLVGTAAARRELVLTRERMTARVARCGSGVVVDRVPYDGLRSQLVATFESLAEGQAGIDCPHVTADEALAFREGSALLRATPALAAAVGELVAWVARAVAIHEARHAVDLPATRNHTSMLACDGCPPELGRTGRYELSAFLAALSSPEASALALYQACDLDRAASGPHGLALETLERRLFPEGCIAGAPEGLRFDAHALDVALFGAHAPLDTSGFPRSLPVD